MKKIIAVFSVFLWMAGAGFAQTTVHTATQDATGGNTFTQRNVFVGPLNYYVDTGAANAYVISTGCGPSNAVCPAALTSLSAGATFSFKAANANTGGSALAVDSVTAIAIQLNGAALVSGNIIAGHVYTVTYNGTNFDMVGSSGGGGGGGSPSGSLGDLQTNAGSSNFGASHINDTGSQLNASENVSFVGPRPYIDITNPAYGATGDGGAEHTTGSITSGTNSLVVASATGMKVGMGLHIAGAGTGGDVLLAKITIISGTTLTLSGNAGTTVTNAVVGDDDTLAIQEAITAFCAGGAAGGGSIYVPPGNYVYAQNQSVNSSGYPFTASCQQIHFVGGNVTNPGSGFHRPPEASLTGYCGPSPNANAAFLLQGGSGSNATFENLVINGCNKAVYVNGATQIHFKNTTLEVQGATGLTDNTPLHIANQSFEIYFDHSSFIANGTTAIPDVLLTIDTANAELGEIYFNGSMFDGGNNAVSYIARATSGQDGHITFEHDVWESGNGAFMSLTDPGNYTNNFTSILMDEVQLDDNAASTPPLVSVNLPSASIISGIHIRNSSGGNAALGGPAVQVLGGSVDSVTVDGCREDGGCANSVVNASNVPAGTGVSINTRGGHDVIENPSLDSGGQQTTNPCGVFGNNYCDGPALRITQSGKSFASYMLDASNGFGFGNPNLAGWNAQIFQNTAPNIDVAFAANYPPSSVSATPSGTGGTIPAGTYYIWMVSSTTSSCSSNTGNFSAPSLIAGPYTLSGTTSSLAVTWTAATAGLTAISGYCVFENSTQGYSYGASASAFISGGSTTSATVTSFPNSPGTQAVTGTMVQVQHLKPSGFDLGTEPIECNGAAGTSGQVLTSGGAGAACTWGSGTFTNPMTTLGDIIYGGASGAGTRLAGPTAPDGVPQALISTPNSSGVAQAPAWSMGGVAIDSQSTTYTIQCSTSGSPNDRLGLVVFTGSSATTFTLPQAVSSATSCFGANFATAVKNEGTAQLTITATTSVFEPQANASIILSPGQSVVIHSDNTNYHADWTGQAGFQALTYNSSGTTTFPAGFSPVANATVTATHSTSTTFSPTNLVNGGYYTVQISQDATGGGVTFTLGTGGSCSAWKVLGGGAGAITLSTAANAIDVLTWYYNGTNCVANFNKNAS